MCELCQHQFGTADMFFHSFVKNISCNMQAGVCDLSNKWSMHLTCVYQVYKMHVGSLESTDMKLLSDL